MSKLPFFVSDLQVESPNSRFSVEVIKLPIDSEEIISTEKERLGLLVNSVAFDDTIMLLEFFETTSLFVDTVWSFVGDVTVNLVITGFDVNCKQTEKYKYEVTLVKHIKQKFSSDNKAKVYCILNIKNKISLAVEG